MAPSFAPSTNPGGRYSLRSKRPPSGHKQASPDIPLPANHKGRKAVWNEARLRTFVELLIREKQKNNGNWVESQRKLIEGWPDIVDTFNKATGANYNIGQLEAKLRGLVAHYDKWLYLKKEQSGLGSDDNGWITASDKFWQKRGMKPIDGKPPPPPARSYCISCLAVPHDSVGILCFVVGTTFQALQMWDLHPRRLHQRSVNHH